MAVNSRSGGYDKAIDEDMKKRDAAKREASGQRVGAQMISRSSGENPDAPTSIGQLMSPSTGRGMPQADPNDNNDADFQHRVTQNESFLSNPETRAALLQFGVSMLATAGGGDIGSNIGKALGSAIQAPTRMRQAQAKLEKQVREADIEERRIRIAERNLGIDEEKLSLEKKQKENRAAIFAALKNASEDKIMEMASELAANGDDEGARLALSMAKSVGGDEEATALMKEYKVWLAQGYTGTIQDFKQAMFKTSVLEGIRGKLASGQPLTPGEQQVYDDAIKTDVLTRALMQSNPDLFATPSGEVDPVTQQPVNTPVQPTAPVNEGVSGNVKFKVVQ